MMDKKIKADMEEARKRLAALPKNPVSEAAMDSMEDEDPEKMDEMRKQWHPVEKLVGAAHQLYMDGDMSCGDAIGNLADSLKELAKEKESAPKGEKPEKEEYPKA